MNPSDLALFSEKEQTLLVATEPARLKLMSQDELGDALLLVRRARNKYTTMHRRQGSATVGATGRRASTQSQNLRTVRKAEIFEDALARVTKAYGDASRRAAAQLKSERLALAKSATASSPSAKKPTVKSSPASTTRKGTSDGRTGGRGAVPKSPTSAPALRGATKARGSRQQAKRDSR
jgi:hypothetical protein